MSTEDYTRDVPMEIGRHFFPRPEIRLPTVQLPKMPSLRNKYLFEAERRARSAYDSRNDRSKEETTKSQEAEKSSPERTAVLTPSVLDFSMTNEVLTPSQAEPRASSLGPTRLPQTTVSFEEFEGRGSVFDELEWKSIDDRKALSQILCAGSMPVSSSEPASPLPTTAAKEGPPPSASAIVLPSYPSLSYNSSVQGSTKDQITTSVATGSVSYRHVPPPPSSAEATSRKSTPNGMPPSSTSNGGSSTAVPLQQRLLNKGYRENLVTVAMKMLPRQRIVHVEYYMKGMSLLEKRGVDVSKTLAFLIESGVTDKQEVLQRAQTADQLMGMGFEAAPVFAAVLTGQGDKVEALDQLLQAA